MSMEIIQEKQYFELPSVGQWFACFHFSAFLSGLYVSFVVSERNVYL